jgi:uracil-DNA glycosylase
MNFLSLVKEYSPVQMRDFFSENMHIVQAISNFIELELEEDRPICPDISQILSCLHLVSMDRTSLLPHSIKVVMILQDPYPRLEDAHGVAMSTLNGQVPMSLRNVYKVLKKYKPDIPKMTSGDIRGWCTQGVLLWNAALTTTVGTSGQHHDQWSLFTTQFVKWLSSTFPFLIFVMFGRQSQGYKGDIDQSKHYIICTSHPVARDPHNTFLESDIFTEINEVLEGNMREPVKWEDYSYI